MNGTRNSTLLAKGLIFSFLATATAFAGRFPVLGPGDLEGPYRDHCLFVLSSLMTSFIAEDSHLVPAPVQRDLRSKMSSRGVPPETVELVMEQVFHLARFANDSGMKDGIFDAGAGLERFVRHSGLDESETAAINAALHLLDRYGRGNIPWRKPKTVYGSDAGVRRVLSEAGVEGETTELIAQGLADIKGMPFSDNPTFEYVRRTLIEHNDRIFVCAVGKSCQFVGGAAGAGAVHLTLRGTMAPVQALTPAGPYRNLGTEGLFRMAEVVALPFPRVDKASRAAWLSHYTHEMTHFADSALRSQWISANQKRIARGREPDALFKEYVRFGREGEGAPIQILKGFHNGFVESRAYDVGNFVFQRAQGIQNLDAGITLLFKRNAVNQIINQSGPDFLRMWGITEEKPDEIFNMGRHLGEMMQRTIDEESKIAK